MATLVQKCVKARYSPKKIGDSKADKELAASLSASYGAEEKRTRVSKKILQCAELDAIKEFDGDTRKVFKEKTAPWGDDGWRILKATDVKQLKSYIDDRTGDREALVQAFIDKYNRLIEEDKRELGGMWKHEDYPTIEKVIETFAIGEDPLEIEVISTEVPDFRAEMSDEEVDEIEANVRKNVEKKQEQALAVVYGRVLDAVNKVVERLSDPANKFHESVIENLKTIVESLPTANFTDDPKLVELGERIKKNLLTNKTVKEYRQSMPVRAEAEMEAKAIGGDIDNILNKMGGVM